MPHALCGHAASHPTSGVPAEVMPHAALLDFLPSGLYRRPRLPTGSYLAARGLGLCLTADREFHPALKVSGIQFVLSVYGNRRELVKEGMRV